MSTISKSNNNGMNNKNSNKTTSLKTFLMLSIIPLVLVIGGVIPVYAQEIRSTDAQGDDKISFYDYDTPECNVRQVLYAEGSDFTPNVVVPIYLTSYPNNQNADNTYSPGSPNVNWGQINPGVSHGVGITTTDAHGSFGNPPIFVSNNLQPGKYNLVTDVSNMRIFATGTDAIDSDDIWGVIVTPCLNVIMEKDGYTIRQLQYVSCNMPLRIP
jgi:hypothetical protein